MKEIWDTIIQIVFIALGLCAFIAFFLMIINLIFDLGL